MNWKPSFYQFMFGWKRMEIKFFGIGLCSAEDSYIVFKNHIKICENSTRKAIQIQQKHSLDFCFGSCQHPIHFWPLSSWADSDQLRYAAAIRQWRTLGNLTRPLSYCQHLRCLFYQYLTDRRRSAWLLNSIKIQRNANCSINFFAPFASYLSSLPGVNHISSNFDSCGNLRMLLHFSKWKYSHFKADFAWKCDSNVSKYTQKHENNKHLQRRMLVRMVQYNWKQRTDSY